ncbi:transposase [Streptomyces olivaceoviridis]
MRFAGGEFTVAGLEGARCRLVDEAGGVQVVLATHLMADEEFTVIGGAPRQRLPARGPLEGLEPAVRERALAWERHIREVETGCAELDGRGRAEYDPTVRSMAEREAAKAAELAAQGEAVSVATVRRMRARYREQGVWGLVDGRAKRGRSAFGRADERVVAAIAAVLEERREKSSLTLSGLRRRVGWYLEELYGAGAVKVPPTSTFNRLVHAVGEGRGLLGSARKRRMQASKPEGPYVPTAAVRPGELVMMDSTLLDVLVVGEDGKTGRCELTVAVDVATRSITAAVLRPRGTKSVDAAILLAQSVVPEPMRPGWSEALSMRSSVIPYERLVGIDARIERAAARPVIWPSTVVVDQGAVFVSKAFLAACEHLGISVQPCPPASGHAKGHVERVFGSVNTLFAQHVAGYTGRHVGMRGRRVEDEACWTLAQLQELLDEWIVVGWQERRHSELRHPLMPKMALSPNEMWAALVGMCGHVPVPLTAVDYIELLPAKRLTIGADGIRFDHRTYDSRELNPYRRRRSSAADGRWEVHYNPYEPTRCWVRLPEGWAQADWIHRTLVQAPFTDATWRHIQAVTDRRGTRAEHEEALARALDELLRRAAMGTGTARERSVAAQAGTGAAMPAGAVHAHDVVAATASRPADADPWCAGDEWDEDFEDEAGFDEVDEPDGVDGLGCESAGKAPVSSGAWKVFDAHAEAERW